MQYESPVFRLSAIIEQWRQEMSRLLLSLGLLMMPLLTHANAWQMEAGGGLAIYNTPWKGVNIEATPIPYFSARYGRW